MGRILVTSDPHGCLRQFNELLRLSRYNPQEDKLIILGDYGDRGPQSKEVIEQVKSMVEEWGVIALMGNHDEMMFRALDGDVEYDEVWLNNGGLQTLESYGISIKESFTWDQYLKAKEFINLNYGHHIDFLRSLPLYYETDTHIFVHAGLNPCYSDDWKLQPEDSFLWVRDMFIWNKTELDKMVVFGHTPTINIHGVEDVWFGGDKIGIDGGGVFGLQFNMLEIGEDGEYKVYSTR